MGPVLSLQSPNLKAQCTITLPPLFPPSLDLPVVLGRVNLVAGISIDARELDVG